VSLPEVGQEYAKFAWWRAELEGCPLRWSVAKSLEVRPCAFARAGALVSQGHGLSSSQTSIRPWSELGASLLLEWTLVGPMALELEGGATLPLIREQFEFMDPAELGYQAPSVMADVKLGVGVHFP
jgi:hypothetical protein